MTRQTVWVLALLVGVTAAGVPTSAQEPQSWLHVHVEGGGDARENVAINLPLQAVGAVMAMAPDDIISPDGRLVVAEEHGVSVSDIRQAWQSIKDAGDDEFVTFMNEELTVRVARAGDRIEVRVEGSGEDAENARVDLPLALVDALLSGDGEALNVAAAIDQLSTLRGDIVRVTEEEREIRVWVDEQSVQ